jgi:hypothetical protein
MELKDVFIVHTSERTVDPHTPSLGYATSWLALQPALSSRV